MIPPQTSLDYYAAMIRHMSGFAATQAFSRLYMIPGLYHCDCGDYGAGSPETHPQFMAELVAWVERSQPPPAVSFPVTGHNSPSSLHTVTLEPTNPLVGVPHNNGLNSNYNYIDIGRVYRPHNQLWCEQRGTRMVCSRHRR